MLDVDRKRVIFAKQKVWVTFTVHIFPIEVLPNVNGLPLLKYFQDENLSCLTTLSSNAQRWSLTYPTYCIFCLKAANLFQMSV